MKNLLNKNTFIVVKTRSYFFYFFLDKEFLIQKIMTPR